MKYVLALLSLALLGLYITTAPPSVYFGDDGEVISAAYTLGIGHPPGYPLYMLYTKISSFLPAGSVAFRANLAAGFLAALAFLLFYLCGKQALMILFGEENRSAGFAALLAASVYSVSNVFWFEAMHSKGAIYLIMHVLVLLTFLSGSYYHRTKQARYFYTALFTAGFLIPAHNSSGMFMLFFIAALYYDARGRLKAPGGFNTPLFVIAPLFFLTGLVTPYLYLFIRMKAAPVINWGNLVTYREVFGHIMRETYNVNTMNASSFGAILYRFANYFSVYISNYWLMAPAAVIGAYFVFKRSKGLFWACAAFFSLNLAALLYVINTSGGFMINDLSPMTLYTSKNFYLASDILTVFAGAAGIYGTVRFLSKKTGINSGFLFALAAVMPLIMAFSNYAPNDKSSEFLAYDHAENILKSVPKGGVLFTGNDCPLFNIVYTQTVQGKYRSVRDYDSGGCLLDYSLYSGMKHKWDSSEFRQIEEDFVAQNPGTVYETAVKSFASSGETTDLYGIIYKAGKKEQESYLTEKLFRLYSLRNVIGKVNPDIFYRSIAASYPVEMASYEVLAGSREKAVQFLKQAAVYGEGSPGVYMNIALVYNLSLQDPQSAVPYIEKVIEDNPYDLLAINIMVRTLMGYDAEGALKWLYVLYSRMPSEIGRKQTYARIEQLKTDIDSARRSKINK